MTNVTFFELEKVLMAFSSVNLRGESQFKMAENLVDIKKAIILFSQAKDNVIKKHFPDSVVDENSPVFKEFEEEVGGLFNKVVPVDFSTFQKININDIDLSKENNQNYLAILLDLGLIIKGI